jgi:glucose/arabinose dehydrogenase
MKIFYTILLSSLLVLAFWSCNSSASNGNNQDNSLNIKLPPGFHISIYADNVKGARSLCLSPDGTLFVGTRGDKVYAVLDTNKDYKADKVVVIASGLFEPNGVAFRDGDLYVAEVNKIIRFDDIENHLYNPPKPVVINDHFPNKTHHGWKFIRFGPDGKLYVPVGAPCNVCLPSDSIFATITRMNPDGSDLEIYEKGIRNTVGFDWNPVTKVLWFTDNGRDLLGDNIPPDELNRAPHQGMNFGFPYMFGSDVRDPDYGKGVDLSKFTKPAMDLGPHVAPLGMRFYTGNMFPPEYKNQIFIAEHGSWNRSKKIGYRIMLVKVKDGKAVSREPFATGWLRGDSVSGRPVDVEVMHDGSLLVSDDYTGVIYRITYSK